MIKSYNPAFAGDFYVDEIIYSKGSLSVTGKVLDKTKLLRFENPLMVRFADEGKLLNYLDWSGVEKAQIYELTDSEFLTQFHQLTAEMYLGNDPEMRHFLVSSESEIVEVIATAGPELVDC